MSSLPRGGSRTRAGVGGRPGEAPAARAGPVRRRRAVAGTGPEDQFVRGEAVLVHPLAQHRDEHGRDRDVPATGLGLAGLVEGDVSLDDIDPTPPLVGKLQGPGSQHDRLGGPQTAVVHDGDHHLTDGSGGAPWESLVPGSALRCRGRQAAASGERDRLASLFGALVSCADVASGFHAEKAIRSAIVATRLAEAHGLDPGSAGRHLLPRAGSLSGLHLLRARGGSLRRRR